MLADAQQRPSLDPKLAALAAELGVATALLTRRGTVVATSERSDRIHVLRLGALTLILTPRSLQGRIEAALAAGQPTGAWLAQVLGADAAYILPWVASAALDPKDFYPAPTTDAVGAVRLLAVDEQDVLADLAEAGRARHASGFKTDWEQSGFGFAPEAVAAVILRGRAVAAAGMRQTSHGTLRLGVLTHPKHRRLGHARRALSLIAQEALSRGLVPEYRSLASDALSRRLAGGLGFRERYHFLLAALRSS